MKTFLCLPQCPLLRPSTILELFTRKERKEVWVTDNMFWCSYEDVLQWGVGIVGGNHVTLTVQVSSRNTKLRKGCNMSRLRFVRLYRSHIKHYREKQYRNLLNVISLLFTKSVKLLQHYTYKNSNVNLRKNFMINVFL